MKAWGLFDGEDGTNTIIAFRRKGETEWVRAREAFGTQSYGKFSNIVMNEGDEMLFVTPSGGGYGDAARARPRARRGRRRATSSCRVEDARADYGVVIDAPTAPWTPPRPTTLRADAATREDVGMTIVPRGQRDAALRRAAASC